MTIPESDEDIARRRFTLISLTRLSGAVLVMLGLLAINRTLEWPEPVGYVLLLVGLADFFVMPLVLARKWRSRSE